MPNLSKLVVVAATPSQARWSKHRWGRSILPPRGVIGWTVPLNFNYVGPSYFSNAPVYVAPYGYAPEVYRYVGPRYYW